MSENQFHCTKLYTQSLKAAMMVKPYIANRPTFSESLCQPYLSTAALKANSFRANIFKANIFIVFTTDIQVCNKLHFERDYFAAEWKAGLKKAAWFKSVTGKKSFSLVEVENKEQITRTFTWIAWKVADLKFYRWNCSNCISMDDMTSVIEHHPMQSIAILVGNGGSWWWKLIMVQSNAYKRLGQSNCTVSGCVCLSLFFLCRQLGCKQGPIGQTLRRRNHTFVAVTISKVGLNYLITSANVML